MSFEEVIEATALGREEFPNAGQQFDSDDLQRRLLPALEVARKRMNERQREFSAQTKQRAETELARLDKLREEHHRQLEIDFKAGDDPLAQIVNPGGAAGDGHHDDKRRPDWMNSVAGAHFFAFALLAAAC